MSFLLSALCGEKITQAQLLGEEAADVAGRTEAAEKELKASEKRRQKAGYGPGLIPVQTTGEVFMG